MDGKSPTAAIEVETGSWTDNVPFFAKRWQTSQAKAPVALLIGLHGFAEHIGRYDHVWPTFAASNIEVFAYDQRGAGQSGPKHGGTTLRQNIEDLKYFILREGYYGLRLG